MSDYVMSGNPVRYHLLLAGGEVSEASVRDYRRSSTVIALKGALRILRSGDLSFIDTVRIGLASGRGVHTSLVDITGGAGHEKTWDISRETAAKTRLERWLLEEQAYGRDNSPYLVVRAVLGNLPSQALVDDFAAIGKFPRFSVYDAVSGFDAVLPDALSISPFELEDVDPQANIETMMLKPSSTVVDHRLITECNGRYQRVVMMGALRSPHTDDDLRGALSATIRRVGLVAPAISAVGLIARGQYDGVHNGNIQVRLVLQRLEKEFGEGLRHVTIVTAPVIRKDVEDFREELSRTVGVWEYRYGFCEDTVSEENIGTTFNFGTGDELPINL